MDLAVLVVVEGATADAGNQGTGRRRSPLVTFALLILFGVASTLAGEIYRTWRND